MRSPLATPPLLLLLLPSCALGITVWRGKFADSVGVNAACGYFRNGTADSDVPLRGLCVVRCAGQECTAGRAACGASSRCVGIAINGEGTLATLKARHRWAAAPHVVAGSTAPTWFRLDECRALAAKGAALALQPHQRGRSSRQPLQEAWRGALCDEYTRGDLLPPLLPPSPAAVQGVAERDLVFDVGYNMGLDTALFLRLGMRVRSVEADAATIDRTARRHPLIAAAAAEAQAEGGPGALLRRARLNVVHGAVAAVAGGSITFYAPVGQPQMASIHKSACNARGASGCVEKVVPTITCAALIREHGTPLLLKVDIEGADLLCLESLRSLKAEGRPLPTYVAVEDNAALDLLAELGYTSFKLVFGREINLCDADDADGGHSLLPNSLGGMPHACRNHITGSGSRWSSAAETRAHHCFGHADLDCPCDLYARLPTR